MPWFNPEYYAYFWVGLERVFGASALSLDDAPFPSAADSTFHEHRATFAFVVDGRRYFITANDHPSVPPGAWDWADVVGAVNVDAGVVSPDSRSLVPLGPAFGVKAWSRSEAIKLARQFATFPRPPSFQWRALRATLARQNRRASLEDFEQLAGQSTSDVVFYLGTFWDHHPEANADRVRFLRVLRAQQPTRTSGGLVSQGSVLPQDIAGLRVEPIGHREYLERTTRSPFAFNHPAVHGCLGWKLGEYLALGKAILTTPIDRYLPGELVDGEHWYVTEATDEAFAAASAELLESRSLRARLEVNARAYYADFVAPEAMIRRLVQS
jgi:hypothetical protein